MDAKRAFLIELLTAETVDQQVRYALFDIRNPLVTKYINALMKEEDDLPYYGFKILTDGADSKSQFAGVCLFQIRNSKVIIDFLIGAHTIHSALHEQPASIGQPAEEQLSLLLIEICSHLKELANSSIVPCFEEIIVPDTSNDELVTVASLSTFADILSVQSLTDDLANFENDEMTSVPA